jgi:hypothetical protein
MQKELLEHHRTLHHLDASCLLWMQETHCISDKYQSSLEQMKHIKMFEKIFIKYLANIWIMIILFNGEGAGSIPHTHRSSNEQLDPGTK